MGCFSSKAVKNVYGSEFDSHVAIPRPASAWCSEVTSGNSHKKLPVTKEQEQSPTEVKIKSQLSLLPTFTVSWARQAAGSYSLRSSKLRKGIRINDVYKLEKTIGTGGENNFDNKTVGKNYP